MVEIIAFVGIYRGIESFVGAGFRARTVCVCVVLRLSLNILGLNGDQKDNHHYSGSPYFDTCDGEYSAPLGMDQTL